MHSHHVPHAEDMEQFDEMAKCGRWHHTNLFMKAHVCCVVSLLWCCAVLCLSSSRAINEWSESLCCWCASLTVVLSCRRVRKLYVNLYTSVINLLRTDIHAYKHSIRLRPHKRLPRQHNYVPHAKAFGKYLFYTHTHTLLGCSARWEAIWEPTDCQPPPGLSGLPYHSWANGGEGKGGGGGGGRSREKEEEKHKGKIGQCN